MALLDTDTAVHGPAASPIDYASWDGRVRSYLPGPDWRDRVSPDLTMHEDVDDGLDAVTYEVIRHRLWTINMAHGETVTRGSGNPTMAAYDFNMSILTEDAEVVLNAPYIQYLNAGAPMALRYVMERYSGDPGIFDGDVYVGNDPWVGAVHQMDVLVCCPVFVDGRLFAWVSNAGHQYDLGGIVPGGWPQNAVDVYYDPVVMPPFKLVERGKMRADLEEVYLRQSRMRDLVALDLRAQLAGVHFARRELLALCEQYGPGTVKAALRRILDEGQRMFAEKLRRLPDGRWSQVMYLDEKLPGDRGTQRMQLNLTKRGDRLIVDNDGTDAQEEGPNGFVYAAFSGGLLGVLSLTMMYESLFAIGGGDRQIDYRPTPGTLSCVDYPAAVSGSVLSVATHMIRSMTTVSRMLACDDELREDIVTGFSEFPLVVLTGIDDRGEFYGQGLLEVYGMGSGARSFHDGVDVAGPAFSPLSFIVNVESQEQFFPVLYLYRKESPDSGGAGRWRGGVSFTVAVTPYRARSTSLITFCSGQGISTHSCPGIFGGYPSPTCEYLVARDTNLLEMFAAGHIPSDFGVLDAEAVERVRGKSNGTPLGRGDVFEVRSGGGGGFGDPLLREPERVLADVADGRVSVEAARSAHGVVVESGSVDAQATRRLRGEIRAERRGWPSASEVFDVGDPTAVAATGDPPRAVHEYVESRDEGGERVLACRECGHVLAGARDNYKRGLRVHEGPVTEVPRVGDPALVLDVPMVFRRYCCPGCQVLVLTEIVRADEGILEELRLS